MHIRIYPRIPYLSLIHTLTYLPHIISHIHICIHTYRHTPMCPLHIVSYIHVGRNIRMHSFLIYPYIYIPIVVFQSSIYLCTVGPSYIHTPIV